MPMILLQSGAPSGNMHFLFAAFAVSWVVFFLYAWFLNRRQQEMAKEIRGLRQALDTQQAVDREER